MSEIDPNQSNLGLPEYAMQVNGQEYHANRLNTTLYTYMGQNAIYDHVFLSLGENDQGESTGAYVFRTKQEKLFYNLEEFCVNNSLPQIINRDHVPNCDKEAWNRTHLSDLKGDIGVPEEWN